MKTKLGVIVGTMTTLLSATTFSNAQAPGSILGDGSLARITAGIFPFASSGYYLLIPANSGNTYQLIGIYNVASSSGTYSYTATGASTAILNFNDSLGGSGTLDDNFATVDSGSFDATANAYPGAYQSGNFAFASGSAAGSIVGKSLLCTVSDGLYPFAYTGSFTFHAAASGNTYTIVGDGVSTANSAGTYSYSLVNRSTGKLVINDIQSGAATAYFGSADASHGWYAVTQPSPGGFQIGSFLVLDTTPPTVTITTPTAGQRWSNSVFTVTGTASDDVQVAQVYYQLFGQGWNPATTANGWVNWSGDITLTVPGTNIVQAYSVDTSGNSSPISGQSIVYVITAPMTVQTNGNGTVTPNYNGQLLEIGKSYSMTATAGAGFKFSNWTGSVPTNAPTVTFIMASNVVLTANFVDVQKPTVSITNPATANTYTFSQTVTISAAASDNVGVTNVEFYDNSALKGSDSTSPYTYDWSFDAINNGTHAWTARAYDAAGNVSTSGPIALTVSIDITPPTVLISTPTNGQVLTTASLTVTGTATDPGSPTSGLNVVQVRLNAGGWSNATGTASWTLAVALSPCGNGIEARSLDKAGNYSSIASNFVTYTPANTVPNTPSNVSPPNGATNVSVTPTLQASVFSDPDPACVGDAHAASQWQVLSAIGTSVADSGTDIVNKVSWTVPSNTLYYGSNYQWQVRYRDSRDGWSSYSTRTWFTNGGPLLTGTKQGINIVLNWPTNTLGFTLQWSTNLGTGNWSSTSPSPMIVNGQYAVTNKMTNNFKFYRLKK